MQADLKACARMRLVVDFDDGSTQERVRTFLFPTADKAMVVRMLGQLLDKMRWRTGAVTLAVAFEQIQDVVMEQLRLFPGKEEREQKSQEVQRYLATRFAPLKKENFEGFPAKDSLGHCLRRAMLAQPGAPLPEWRVSWLDGDDL